MTRITCQPDWATRIRQMLDAQGRSQIWLAKQVNRNNSTITRILNATPGYDLEPDLMEAIARALGIPSDWLYTDTGPKVDINPEHEETEQALIGGGSVPKSE